MIWLFNSRFTRDRLVSGEEKLFHNVCTFIISSSSHNVKAAYVGIEAQDTLFDGELFKGMETFGV